jgi:UDP-N-acetylglucosamine--N-acetylmuramyl-(pentapeptide) pyrophosphoryl-undecaprenol N-acetylglucosamine transferase
MKKALIVAGGTGGHLYPGICLAREMQKNGFETEFVLGDKDRGIPILNKEKIKYHTLRTIGLPRRPSFKLISFVYYLIVSFINALNIIKNCNPGVVVGLGGYISFPVICVAKILHINTLIHEQNYLPGLANRLLGKVADKIAVSFNESAEYFPKQKVVLTGNPVRRDLFESVDRKEVLEQLNLDDNKFTVLVFGGSQGAHAINSLMVNSLKFLENVSDRIQFVHITGENDFLWVKQTYERSKVRFLVTSYLHEMSKGYKVADLVICRAGATTIAELIAVRKPAILIPFPYAAGKHQKYNAQYLAEPGAAILISEKELNTEKLPVMANMLADFVTHPEKIMQMKECYQNLPRLDSSKLLADIATHLPFIPS